MQLLQQQFFDMRMKLDIEVVDHVSSIEQLAHQLNNLGEPILNKVVICKILSTLPHHFCLLTWNSVPRNKLTIEALTMRLLKEESQNKIQEDMNKDEDKAFFTSQGQGLVSNPNQRPLFAKERKRRSAKITELKNEETKCQKCGKMGHWKHECLDNNKNNHVRK